MLTVHKFLHQINVWSNDELIISAVRKTKKYNLSEISDGYIFSICQDWQGYFVSDVVGVSTGKKTLLLQVTRPQSRKISWVR